MRGKVREGADRQNGRRITPAYAGKRIFFNPLELLTKDHPRLCGEKVIFICVTYRYLGSPPPMRGKASCLSAKFLAVGITPAYAGKSIDICSVL